RLRCGLDRIDGDLDVAVSAVLETYRARKAGSQLTVNLAFGSARTDGAPGHQVGNILRGDHVEEFAARRQAELVDFDQQLTRRAQALVDIEAAIQSGIVDQPLPAHRGARLLEVHAHDD